VVYLYICTNIRIRTDDVHDWRRVWEFDIGGLGSVHLEWTDVKDHGRGWLLNKDKEFEKSLESMICKKRKQRDTLGDVTNVTSTCEEDTYDKCSLDGDGGEFDCISYMKEGAEFMFM